MTPTNVYFEKIIKLSRRFLYYQYVLIFLRTLKKGNIFITNEMLRTWIDLNTKFAKKIKKL